MLELHAYNFLVATTQLARLRVIVENAPDRDEQLNQENLDLTAEYLTTLYGEAEKIGAKLACVATDRFYRRLKKPDQITSFAELGDALRDIESRFADHLTFVQLLVIPEERLPLFRNPASLLTEHITALYPSIRFDCEEAAKSLCLGRFTAAVFHAMRMLETGIGSFAKRLEIPDPVKAAERNWGIMLTKIKTELDAKYPASRRMPHSEGAKLDEIFASLDAIKHPWRNATMHVETIYMEHEASHILFCTANLLAKMAAIFDEKGEDARSITAGEAAS